MNFFFAYATKHSKHLKKNVLFGGRPVAILFVGRLQLCYRQKTCFFQKNKTCFFFQKKKKFRIKLFFSKEYMRLFFSEEYNFFFFQKNKTCFFFFNRIKKKSKEKTMFFFQKNKTCFFQKNEMLKFLIFILFHRIKNYSLLYFGISCILQ